MLNLKEAVIYWIHLPEHTDIKYDGYVGVTQNLEQRLHCHYRDIKNKKHKNQHLVNAVGKYGWDNLIKEVWLSGAETFCYEYETVIRPHRGIGWNIAPGGHKGPGWVLGKKRDSGWLEQQRKKRAPLLEQKRLLRLEEKNKKLEARRAKKEEKQKIELARKLALEERRRVKKVLLEQKKLKRESLEHKRRKTGFYKIDNKIRPICPVCNKNPRAPAYYRNSKRYYRSRCSQCIAKNKQAKPPSPKWRNNGYKKKTTCDLCGFKSTYTSQIVVYHIDGNLNNVELYNLRSICLCCVEIVKRKNTIWRPGDIEPDR